MFETFRQSFSLRCTANANMFLFALKKIPIIKKLIPEAAYSEPALKTFAKIVILLFEIGKFVLGKLAYLGIMVALPVLPVAAQHGVPKSTAFLHILLFLTLVGGIVNVCLFKGDERSYQAINLLQMDARRFTLSNFIYYLICTALSFLPFMLLFGILSDVPVWLCLLLPLAIVGTKLAFAALNIFSYNRIGLVADDTKAAWVLLPVWIILLLAAYIPPIAGIIVPPAVSAGILLAMIPLGALSVRTVIRFRKYKEVNQQLLRHSREQMDTNKNRINTTMKKQITADVTQTSSRSGFEFLNELFVKRHRKLLWGATLKVSAVLAVLLAILISVIRFVPSSRAVIHDMLLTRTSVLWIVLYAINRSAGFTQACFMNCDNAMLTYPFFKKPGSILKLFRIRLRSLMKINALPAGIIGAGMTLMLAMTGGTDQPVHYLVLLIAPVAINMFFSVHFLMLYYLFQPYTAGSVMKGGVYNILTTGTYMFCYFMMRAKLPTFGFGLVCILFCAAYFLIACALVYKFAPKTFKIHN